MKNRRILEFITPFAAVLVIVLALPASAQKLPDFELSVGWFPTTFSSSANLASNVHPGTKVNLEDDLGFDTNAQNVRIEGMWRFKPRHRFDFAYTSWRRTAEKSIEKPIDWGDYHFDTAAHVKATNNAQFIKLQYSYSFIKTDTTDFAGSFGFDTVWNRTSLEGNASIIGSGGNQAAGFYKDKYDFIAPAPVLGVNYTHLAAQDWLLKASTEYFQATVNDTTAKILDVRGSADWFFKPNYAVGLGYTWVGYKVERPRFDATYDFSGPLLYFTWRP